MDFSVVTRRALRHALSEAGAALQRAELDEMMKAYDSLQTFPDVKPMLEKLKNVKALVSFLFDSLEEEIWTITKALKPTAFHYGLRSIPDEVLSAILSKDIGNLDYYESEEIGKSRLEARRGSRYHELQLICRHIQFVVHSSWECCAYVSNFHHADSLTLWRQRWRHETSPIYLSIHARGKGPKPQDFWEANSPYWDRIRSVTWTGSANRLISTTRELPSVRSLSIRETKRFPPQIFSHLTSLECDIPLVPTPEAFPFLLHCSFCFRSYLCPERRELWVNYYNRVTDFLQTTPLLQSLRLYITGLSDYEDEWDDSRILVKTITLHKLKSLALHHSSASRRNRFLENLKITELLDMEISINDSRGSYGLEGLSSLSRSRYLSVKNLTFALNRDSNIEDDEKPGMTSVSLSDIH